MATAKELAANLIAKVPSPKGCGCQARKEKLVEALRNDVTLIDALKGALKR